MVFRTNLYKLKGILHHNIHVPKHGFLKKTFVNLVQQIKRTIYEQFKFRLEKFASKFKFVYKNRIICNKILNALVGLYITPEQINLWGLLQPAVGFTDHVITVIS